MDRSLIGILLDYLVLLFLLDSPLLPQFDMCVVEVVQILLLTKLLVSQTLFVLLGK